MRLALNGVSSSVECRRQISPPLVLRPPKKMQLRAPSFPATERENNYLATVVMVKKVLGSLSDKSR